MTERMTVQAACHCRRVRFEALLVDGLNTARRCDCSFCRMRGAVVVSADSDGIRILEGEDALTEYRFKHRDGEALFLRRLRDLHPPPAPLEPAPVRRECGVHRGRQPFRFPRSPRQ